eukprot:EG_transcript_22953
MRWAPVGLLACLLLHWAAGHEALDAVAGGVGEGEEWEDEPWTPEADVVPGSAVHRAVTAVRHDVERANYQNFYEWVPLQYREFTAAGHWWHPDGRYVMARVRISHFDVAHIRLFLPAGTQTACLEAYRPLGEVIGRNTDAAAPLEVMEAMEGPYGCGYHRTDFGGPAEAEGRDPGAEL